MRQVRWLLHLKLPMMKKQNSSIHLLTSKPVIFAANVAEDDLADDGASNEYVQKVREYAAETHNGVFVISARIEEEIAALSANKTPEQGDSTAQSDGFPEFQGTDLDGNSVDNSLFSNNKFTVVNFWFNGCKPCVEELDDLNALNERIKEQGGEVIGINTETLDGNQQGIETAKQLLESTGAAYRNIYFDANSDAGKFALGVTAFPTTYVIDSNGKIVGEPLLGGIDNQANLDTLQKTIDTAIAESK